MNAKGGMGMVSKKKVIVLDQLEDREDSKDNSKTTIFAAENAEGEIL
jgi:hypothetical protein